PMYWFAISLSCSTVFVTSFLMDPQLRNQVVVVTGASGGIGSAIARTFAAEGARLVLHYHKGRSRIAKLEKEIASTESLTVSADLSLEAGAKRLFAEAVKRFNRVDTLVANAGFWVTPDVPLHQMTLRQWRR